MRTQYENGIIEISGDDLRNLEHVVDGFDVVNLANMAARRMLQGTNRKSGMSFREAKSASADAKATPKMYSAVRAALARGCNPEQAISAAIMAQ